MQGCKVAINQSTNQPFILALLGLLVTLWVMRSTLPTTEMALSRLGWAAVGLLLLVMGLIGLISAGVFDPPLVAESGEVVVLNRPIATTNRTIDWLDQPITTPTTIRLTANHTDGELDSGYGLAVGTPDDYLVVAVSPLGYVMVAAVTATDVTSHVLWQTWPHVATDSATNELQLDITDAEVTARVNREWLWSGAWAGGDEVGLYVETFNRPVTIQFQQLELLTP